MRVLLISDLHLNENNPIVIWRFLYFLRNRINQIHAVYILGDLFDYWIGDDHLIWFHKIIFREFKNLKYKGILCYFIHGNRDFLIGSNFFKDTDIIPLPSESVITLFGHNILMLHGDTLCTDDVSYQRYRNITHNFYLKKIFLSFPLFLRRYIAKKIRKNSEFKKKCLKRSKIMNVNNQTVLKKFLKYKVNYIIHGHTHIPGIHKIIFNNKIFYRIALGAWERSGTCVVRASYQKIELLNIVYF